MIDILESLFLPPVYDGTLYYLLELLTKSGLVLGMVWLVLAVWHRPSASVRHLIWTTALAAVILLPVLGQVMPSWEVVPAESVPLGSLRPIAIPGEITGLHIQSTVGAVGGVSFSAIANQGEGLLETDGHSGGVGLPNGWLLVWLLGSLVATGYLLGGLWRIRVVVKRARPQCSQAVNATVTACRHRLGLKRPVRLLISSDVKVPFAWGWRQSVVILPTIASTWTDSRLKAVLLHELAHIRRHDLILLLLSRMATIVYWFHPLVWLVLGRLAMEREKASDDCVLDAGVEPYAYADHLLKISRTAGTSVSPALNVALTRKSHLEKRLKDIMKTGQSRSSVSLPRLLTTSLVIIAVTMIMASLATITATITAADSQDVTPGERAAVIATLSSFYEAINEGEDYEFIRESFLTKDYFDDPALTLESTDRVKWNRAFENTTQVFRTEGMTGPYAAKARVSSIRREGDKYVVSQTLTMTGDRFVVDTVIETSSGITIKVATDPATGRKMIMTGYLAQSLEHEVVLTVEDGEWKIARYDDGLTIGRMDINNQYGPIYLIWLEDLGPEITPYGEFVSKVIPSWNRPFNNMGVTFHLGE